MGRTRQQPLGSIPSFSGKRFWLSSTPYVPGSMTPDQKCAAVLPQGASRAVAFIAYSSRPASAVIDPAATYVLPDGRLVGTGARVLAMDLAAGAWAFADGTPVPSGPDYVWTGSSRATSGARSGTLAPGTLESTCRDWTSAGTTDMGLVGYSPTASSGAWESNALPCISTQVFLYCVEP